MKIYLALVFLLLELTVIKSQRAYMGVVNPVIEEACREEANISAEKILQYEAESINCVDRFEEVEEASCYHACILRKFGTTDADGNPVMSVITAHISYINAQQIENITLECYKSYRGDSECGKQYYVHKCTDKSIGRYPYQTMHVPIDNVDPDVAEYCRKAIGLTTEELCEYDSNTEKDMFSEVEAARCYQVCILREMGYVRYGMPRYDVYRERYSYIGLVQFLRTFARCFFTEQITYRKCGANYDMYKCMKEGFAEFPSPDHLTPIEGNQ